MVSPEIKELLKGLGIKLFLGVLGFIAAFAADNLGLFHISPALVAVLVALLDNLALWANTYYDVAGKVARFADRMAQSVAGMTGKVAQSYKK